MTRQEIEEAKRYIEARLRILSGGGDILAAHRTILRSLEASLALLDEYYAKNISEDRNIVHDCKALKILRGEG